MIDDQMKDVLDSLREALYRADSAWAAIPPDEDAWYIAMHHIRDFAWEGKELIHDKRLAEHEATRSVRKVHVSVKTKLSPEELDRLMQDLGL